MQERREIRLPSPALAGVAANPLMSRPAEAAVPYVRKRRNGSVDTVQASALTADSHMAEHSRGTLAKPGQTSTFLHSSRGEIESPAQPRRRMTDEATLSDSAISHQIRLVVSETGSRGSIQRNLLGGMARMGRVAYERASLQVGAATPGKFSKTRDPADNEISARSPSPKFHASGRSLRFGCSQPWSFRRQP